MISALTSAATALILPALAGVAAIVVCLAPELGRQRRLRRENEELRRQHDQLAAENREEAASLLENWQPSERAAS